MASGTSPRITWTDETLQPLRGVGDPLADDVITELFADGGVDAMNALMRDFVANEHPVPANFPAPVRHYLEQSSQLPAWADPATINAGEELFWRFGPRIILVLCCYSLPFCYLGRNGVAVLALTKRLSSNPRRRIVETAQMVVDCMQAGGLTTPGGRGRLTIQKVRLMHAAIRRLAPTAPTYRPEFGVPVNQEDLAGTLMSFSWIGIDGLAKLEIPLTADDQQAYIHCWNVVGHLLGVQEGLLPSGPAEAKALADGIAAHQFGPSQDGKDLTTALVDMMKQVLPGTVFDRVPELMIRYFLGRQRAEWLGVHDSFLLEMMSAPLRLLGLEFGGMIEDSKTMGALAERTGRALIDSIMYVERGGNRPGFAIP
ncbi:MAG: oxygenase MpaB family protein, partial [Acidobacteriota bacterium]